MSRMSGDGLCQASETLSYVVKPAAVTGDPSLAVRRRMLRTRSGWRRRLGNAIRILGIGSVLRFALGHRL